VRHHLGGVASTHGQVPARQGRDRIGAAGEGNDGDRKACPFGHGLQGHVHDACRHGGRGGDPVAGLGVGDQFLHRLDRGFSAHADDDGVNREPGDRGEILEGIIGHLLKVWYGQIGARSLSQIEGISVRLGTDDIFDAQDAAGTRLGDDDHRLGAVLWPDLRHGACQNIVGAAGGKGDDDLNRFGRELVLAEAQASGHERYDQGAGNKNDDFTHSRHV